MSSGGRWLGMAVGLVMLTLAAEAGEQPARVSLEARREGGLLRIVAVVVDQAGAGVADVPVQFRLRTTFGWLWLGEAKTNPGARAELVVPSSPRVTELRAEAGEEGGVGATLRLDVEPPPPRVRPGRDILRTLSPQPGLISPHLLPEQVAVLGILLSGIWATYAVVGWLLLRIRAGH